MGFIKKQDDNLTIWQFDDNLQASIDQANMCEIVKLPYCHDKNKDDADSSSRGRTEKGLWLGCDWGDVRTKV